MRVFKVYNPKGVCDQVCVSLRDIGDGDTYFKDGNMSGWKNSVGEVVQVYLDAFWADGLATDIPQGAEEYILKE